MCLDTALRFKIVDHSPNRVHTMWNDMDPVKVVQITAAAAELNKTNWMGKNE